MLLDIGGYFSACAEDLRHAIHLLGIVEDTEKGHQKYERRPPSVPVLSVERSRFKRAEDYHVGRSVVYSSEALLRGSEAPRIGKTALVIGYGKIGQSIASDLARRGVRVLVADADPTQRVWAATKGYAVPPKSEALPQADLIYAATGNRSLAEGEFRLLKRGPASSR